MITLFYYIFSLFALCNTMYCAESTVIFIHGTFFPFVTKFVHKVECPTGLHLAQTLKDQNSLKFLSRYLAESDPIAFPFQSFYFYGWAGSLSFKDRYNAALELFSFLAKRKGPLTIIGHSHGCNVALYLAHISRQRKVSLTIDKLILLACPVQEATAAYIDTPIFKKIYHFYSVDDFAQVCDPQGLYTQTSDSTVSVPFFSQRTFKPCCRLIQAQVLLNHQSPGHNDFILNELFIRKLPYFIDLLDKECKRRASDHYTLDISATNELKLTVNNSLIK